MHYDRALDTDSVLSWPRDPIRMTSYMVRANFRPTLRHTFETTHDEHHLEFSPDHLCTSESTASITNDSLRYFPESRAWAPNRGPGGRLLLPLDLIRHGPRVIGNAPSVSSKRNIPFNRS